LGRLSHSDEGHSGHVPKHRSLLILFSEARLENVADADDADNLAFRHNGHWRVRWSVISRMTPVTGSSGPAIVRMFAMVALTREARASPSRDKRTRPDSSPLFLHGVDDEKHSDPPIDDHYAA
jgi:hypothetical protein